MRECVKCGEVKPLEGFSPDKHSVGGRRRDCKDCVRERNRRWRDENPEKMAASRRRWNVANAERMREYRRDYESRRDPVAARLRQAGLPFDQDAVDYGHVLLRDPCAYCGAPADTIDHIIPVSAGGTNTWDNLTAACFSCNQSKSARPLLHALLHFAWRAEQ